MRESKRMELNVNEMNQVAGGYGRGHRPRSKITDEVMYTYCNCDTNGPKHQFEFTRTEGEDYYGISTCALCGFIRIVETNPSPLDLE